MVDWLCLVLFFEEWCFLYGCGVYVMRCIDLYLCVIVLMGYVDYIDGDIGFIVW